MGIRLGRLFSAFAVVTMMLGAGASPAGAVTVPAPVGDAPTLVPGTQIPDNGEDDSLLQFEWDYINNRTAGDTQLTLDQAGQHRAKGADTAAAIRLQGNPGGNVTFNGAWSAAGPSPIGQIARSNGALEAVAGRIGALAIRKNGRFILGGANGGIWTMDPADGVWVPRTDNLPSLATGALEVAPSNDLIVYDGTGEGALSGDSYFGDGILKSTDGGTTWQHVSGDFFQGVSVARLAIDPTNADHLYAAVLRGRGGSHRTTPTVHSQYGIWESKDGGVSWTLLMGSPAIGGGRVSEGATELRIDPITPNVLYSSFLGDKMYKSVDGGQTWNPIMSGLPAEADFSAVPTRFSIGLSHPAGQSAVLYVGFDFANNQNPPPPQVAGAHRVARIYKSTDGGATWFRAGFQPGPDGIQDYCTSQCTYDNVIEPDPTDPNVVFAAGSFGYTFSPQSGGIYRSDDGGATWKDLGWNQHPDFHSVVFDPNNSQNVLIGNDGGVWYSTDRGGRVPGTPGATNRSANDWTDLNGHGLQITQFSSIQANPSFPQVINVGGVPTDVGPSARLWGGTQDNGTLRKSATSNTWFDMTSGDGGMAQVDPTDFNYVYGEFFAPPLSVYRITDAGAGFFTNKPIHNGLNLNDRAEFYAPLVLNQANPNQLFIGSYRLYRTDDAKTQLAGDVQWNVISPDLTSGCKGPAPNGARNCTLTSIGVGGGTGVYTGSNDGVVYVSPDAQTSLNPTWVRINGLPSRPVGSIAVDRSNWRIAYIAFNGFDAATPNNPGHVFKTIDGGQTFQNVTGNLPDVPVNWLVQDPAFPDTIYAATDVGPFVSFNGGGHWYALGTGFPIVGIDQISLDTFHRVLVAGSHGRGAWRMTDTAPAAPALVIANKDAGVPVGPGSFIDYTLTVSNIGNAGAGGVRITDLLPANTTFVSADNGGQFADGQILWRNLVAPAGDPSTGGGQLSVHLRVQIDPNLASSVNSIVNDGVTLRYSGQSRTITGSPAVTPIAPPFAVSISPSAQTGGARSGGSQTYTETVKNLGFRTDHFNLTSSGGTFPVSFYNSSCSGTAITATSDLAAGASVDICVKVSPQSSATDGTSSTSAVTATSAGSSAVSASANITTIAVTVDTLLVDEDGNAPDVNALYDAALNSAGMTHDTWDIDANPTLPVKYVEAFKNVVWFTGTSYPGPMLPYEKTLTAYLSGGGNLMLSGQDILDQGAGTTDFVHNFLHVNWDGSERQNDIATTAFHGVAGSLTDGIGTVPRTNVLGTPFMDEITPNAGTVIFTDDRGQPDGLAFNGTYRLVFLPFGFEEYGAAADKAAFMTRVNTFFTTP
ncbi:MAG TPA: hypothetical protein VFL27_12175 [Candidatus Dormibacteraeota bacterium]|nr:hypothetical protein [Candidatus Dormibacteraeota bacterium]